MIQLPIEIGDVVLGGRFKNKKITVKEIGTDEHGLPTINGRGILKIRIQKLMKPKSLKEILEPVKVKIKQKDKKFNLHLCSVDGDDEILNKVPFETKDLAAHHALTKGWEVENYEQPTNLKESLKQVIREIISEINLKKKLSEVDVNDPKLEKAINELSDLEKQLAEAEAQIAELKKKLNVSQMEKRYKELVDNELGDFLNEMKKDDERVARTKNVLMTIKRFQAEKEVTEYKQLYLFAMTQVNQDVKAKILDMFKVHTKITKVIPALSFSKTESLIKEENLFQKLGNWIVRQLDAIAPKLARQGEKIDNALDKLERVLKIN
jgi:hypothetical protein